MTLLKLLRKTLNVIDSKKIARSWIVKYTSEDRIREVKLLHNSNTYNGIRPILNDTELLSELELDKSKNND